MRTITVRSSRLTTAVTVVIQETSLLSVTPMCLPRSSCGSAETAARPVRRAPHTDRVRPPESDALSSRRCGFQPGIGS